MCRKVVKNAKGDWTKCTKTLYMGVSSKIDDKLDCQSANWATAVANYCQSNFFQHEMYDVLTMGKNSHQWCREASYMWRMQMPTNAVHLRGYCREWYTSQSQMTKSLMCTGLIFVFAMKYNGHFIKQPFMSMFLVICDLIDSVSCHGKYRRMTRTLVNCCAIVQIVNQLCKLGIQD